MKKILFVLPAFLTFYSCSENSHPDANSLCKCYTELHRAYDEEEVDRIADSCNTIYTDILNKYSGDSEGKKEFEKAYKNCQ